MLFRCALALSFVAALGAGGAASEAEMANLHAKDGSGDPPKLWIVVNLWGLIGVPAGEAEWTLDTKLARLRAAGGFDAVDRFNEADPKSEAAVGELGALAQKHRFRVGMHTHIDREEQIDPAIALAKKVGTPYVDVMTGPYGMPEPAVIALVRTAVERFRAAGIAMVLQTHRGLVTQDLLRTIEYTKQIPDLRFDLDLSHYIVAGEIGGDFSAETAAAIGSIAERAIMLDGRVSNGEQVQIDIGPDGNDPHAQRFAGVWKKTMTSWLRRAKPGDVFPFRIELGPPNYAIRDPAGREISDRWQQTLVMRTLAERIWNEAVRETGIGLAHGGATPTAKD